MTEVLPQLVLCSTARLARGLNNAHARAQRSAGMRLWQPLQALTLTQWLGNMTQRVMLSGAVPAQDIPHLTLNGMAERLLWEKVTDRAPSPTP